MSFGVSGHGSGQQLMTLRHHVWKYDPDVVVLAFFAGNDISDNNAELAAYKVKPFFDLVDGELVVCGRIKDVIIVGGRNVFPEEIERAVGGVEGVRAGNVIAFGVEGRSGKEELIVVAETRADEVIDLRTEVARQVVVGSGAVNSPRRSVCTSRRTSVGSLVTSNR